MDGIEKDVLVPKGEKNIDYKHFLLLSPSGKNYRLVERFDFRIQ